MNAATNPATYLRKETPEQMSDQDSKSNEVVIEGYLVVWHWMKDSPWSEVEKDLPDFDNKYEPAQMANESA